MTEDMGEGVSASDASDAPEDGEKVFDPHFRGFSFEMALKNLDRKRHSASEEDPANTPMPRLAEAMARLRARDLVPRTRIDGGTSQDTPAPPLAVASGQAPGDGAIPGPVPDQGMGPDAKAVEADVAEGAAVRRPIDGGDVLAGPVRAVGDEPAAPGGPQVEKQAKKNDDVDFEGSWMIMVEPIELAGQNLTPRLRDADEAFRALDGLERRVFLGHFGLVSRAEIQEQINEITSLALEHSSRVDDAISVGVAGGEELERLRAELDAVKAESGQQLRRADGLAEQLEAMTDELGSARAEIQKLKSIDALYAGADGDADGDADDADGDATDGGSGSASGVSSSNAGSDGGGAGGRGLEHETEVADVSDEDLSADFPDDDDDVMIGEDVMEEDVPDEILNPVVPPEPDDPVSEPGM